MAVYPRHLKDGSTVWYYRFMFEGKIYRRVGGTTRTQAERNEARLRAELIDNKHGVRSPTNPTLGQFTEKFLERRAAIKSVEREQIATDNLIRFFGYKTRLDRILPEQISEFMAWRIEHGAAAGTVNRELGVLRLMYNLAIRWGEVRYNPVSGVRFLKERILPSRCLEVDEAQALIDACHDYFRPIVVLALNTGMRLAEILTLKWHQVDLDRGHIELVETKSGDFRFVTLNETAIDTLSSIEKISKFVFIGTRGEPLKSIRKPWATAKRRAGIEASFRFHDLRHTYISYCLMAGMDLYTIADQVGHQDLRLIRKRYGHLTAEHKRRMTSGVDGIFATAAQREAKPAANVFKIGEKR